MPQVALIHIMRLCAERPVDVHGSVRRFMIRKEIVGAIQPDIPQNSVISKACTHG